VVNAVILTDVEGGTGESGEDAGAEVAAASEGENCGGTPLEMASVEIGGSIINELVGVEGPKPTSRVAEEKSSF
jgi:hypothetical protein